MRMLHTRLAAMVAAMVALTGVVSWGATGTSTWSSASNGDWTNTASWTGGIPDPATEVRLTAGGASYTATWSGGGTPFEDLVITNTVGHTTTLNIDAPGFLSTNGIVRLGRGARMYVRPGGEWRWSGSNTVAQPLIAVDNDAELHIAGGSMIFSNLVGTTGYHAAFNLGSVVGSTGSLYVTGGLLEFRHNMSSFSGLRVGPAGRGYVNQSGGTVVIQNVLGNSADDQYDYRIANGEYNISGGLLLLNCYMQIYNPGTGSSVLRISGDGIVTNIASRESYIGTSAGMYGEVNISGGRLVQAGNSVFVGSSTGTGVVQVTGGELLLSGVRVGYNSSATGGKGICTLGGGYMRIGGYADGMVIGMASAANNHGRGELTVTNGILHINGPGDNGYNHLAGLVLGYSLAANVTGVARGEFNLSGGAVTNVSGVYGAYLILGYNPGSVGIMTQTGGRYVQPSGKWPAVVGYGGGSGKLTISNGVFELNGTDQSLYAGGYANTADLYRYQNGWTNVDNYAGTGPSTGMLEMAGGTLRIAGNLVLGTNGQGTAVFSGGTTTAKNLVLCGPGATLGFTFGATNLASTLSVTNMTIAAGAKLEVNADALGDFGIFTLVDCVNRTGSFSLENVTITGTGQLWIDQTSSADIVLHRRRWGTVISIR